MLFVQAFAFEESESFGETGPLEIMRELGIERLGQGVFELLDVFGNFLQALEMALRVALIEVAIRDDGKAFAQSGDELGLGGLVHTPQSSGLPCAVHAARAGFG